MEGSGGWGRKVVYRPESVIRAAGIRSLRPARGEGTDSSGTDD